MVGRLVVLVRTGGRRLHGARGGTRAGSGALPHRSGWRRPLRSLGRGHPWEAGLPMGLLDDVVVEQLREPIHADAVEVVIERGHPLPTVRGPLAVAPQVPAVVQPGHDHHDVRPDALEVGGEVRQQQAAVLRRLAPVHHVVPAPVPGGIELAFQLLRIALLGSRPHAERVRVADAENRDGPGAGDPPIGVDLPVVEPPEKTQEELEDEEGQQEACNEHAQPLRHAHHRRLDVHGRMHPRESLTRATRHHQVRKGLHPRIEATRAFLRIPPKHHHPRRPAPCPGSSSPMALVL